MFFFCVCQRSTLKSGEMQKKKNNFHIKYSYFFVVADGKKKIGKSLYDAEGASKKKSQPPPSPQVPRARLPPPKNPRRKNMGSITGNIVHFFYFILFLYLPQKNASHHLHHQYTQRVRVCQIG